MAVRPAGSDPNAYSVLHSAQMRSMWRWSVPQQPPSTLICGRRRTMRAVLAAQLHGVAGVQVRRLVELGVAALRRVGADAADAAEPGALARKRGSEMSRVRTVDHVVGRRTLRRLVHLGDRLLQALSGGQASVRLQREGDRRRHAGGLGRARDADRLAGVGHGDGRHHVGLGAGEDADLPGMVGLRLVGAHDGARHRSRRRAGRCSRSPRTVRRPGPGARCAAPASGRSTARWPQPARAMNSRASRPSRRSARQVGLSRIKPVRLARAISA